ncbi:MAG TPA: oligopeptide/dipeptide ABC transporter ATP-binding protein [Gemmatimonadales bacterium]|nr:oligopeptide/dipeptide ABC transporter ATP-binding protein [Gemmatimonadales bacterium]
MLAGARAGPQEAGGFLSALVQVDGLVKHYRGNRGWLGLASSPPVRAVDGVSFSIDAGKTLALVGETGSGKTTVGRTLLRLVEPTEGRFIFDGLDVFGLKSGPLRAVRRSLQVIFQDPSGSLNPRLTAGDAIAEALIIHRLAARAERPGRIAELLREVGLDPSFAPRYPHELSGGQRQRVGIARALAVRPQFLICDEPVTALDVSVQAQVLNLLRDLQRIHGLTYLFIAHDLAVVRHVADEVAVMYAGQIVERGPADRIYSAPRHPYTRALLSAVPVPDPDAPRSRIVLSGDVPSPTHPPAGCRFHPRCPHPLKDSRCASEIPELRDFGNGQVAACHFGEKPM